MRLQLLSAMLAFYSAVGLAPQETAGQDDACQLTDLESSALRAPRNRELLERYEECLIASFADSRVLWHELKPEESERVARELVARTRTSTPPAILSSLNPAFPVGIGLQASGKHDMGVLRPAAEAMAKNILARCTVDDEFAEQYVHLVLWSGWFVVDVPNIDQSDALQIHLGVIEENASKDAAFWQYALDSFIIAELLGYRDQHVFPLEKNKIAEYSKSLVAWAKKRRFAIKVGEYRWEPVELLPIPEDDRPVLNAFESMELPSKPLPSLFDYNFPRLREELYGP